MSRKHMETSEEPSPQIWGPARPRGLLTSLWTKWPSWQPTSWSATAPCVSPRLPFRCLSKTPDRRSSRWTQEPVLRMSQLLWKRDGKASGRKTARSKFPDFTLEDAVSSCCDSLSLCSKRKIDLPLACVKYGLENLPGLVVLLPEGRIDEVFVFSRKLCLIT